MLRLIALWQPHAKAHPAFEVITNQVEHIQARYSLALNVHHSAQAKQRSLQDSRLSMSGINTAAFFAQEWQHILRLIAYHQVASAEPQLQSTILEDLHTSLNGIILLANSLSPLMERFEHDYQIGIFRVMSVGIEDKTLQWLSEKGLSTEREALEQVLQQMKTDIALSAEQDSFEPAIGPQ